MPLLNILITSTTQTISLPQTVLAKHLHLKMIHVNLSAAAAADNLGIELKLPFLHHNYQITSSVTRPNILVPLSHDVKSTTVYPDVIFVGDSLGTFKVELLDPSDASVWTDSGGATLGSMLVQFEYSIE